MLLNEYLSDNNEDELMSGSKFPQKSNLNSRV